MRNFMVIGGVLLAGAGLALPVLANPSTVDRPIPNEYESLGGHALGLNDGGMAALSGVSAVRANPAMLSLERQYALDAAWHWPSRGRDYHEIGIVDSKTASFAAGFLYHGFMDNYDPQAKDAAGDSPLKHRMVLGLSQAFDVVSVGVGGQYVEAADIAENAKDSVRGVSLNAGLAGLLTPALRIGASVESIANTKIRNYAPRTTRAGLAWMLAEGNITMQMDIRDRQRVPAFEGDWPHTSLDGSKSSDGDFSGSERMAMMSFSAKFRDMLCLLGGYNHSLSDDRRSLAAGLALVNPNFSFAYALQRPNLLETKLHHSVSLNLKINL